MGINRDEQIEVIDTVLKGIALIILSLPKSQECSGLIEDWMNETESLIKDMRNE
jgi:hypothetical protein